MNYPTITNLNNILHTITYLLSNAGEKSSCPKVRDTEFDPTTSHIIELADLDADALHENRNEIVRVLRQHGFEPDHGVVSMGFWSKVCYCDGVLIAIRCSFVDAVDCATIVAYPCIVVDGMIKSIATSIRAHSEIDGENNVYALLIHDDIFQFGLTVEQAESFSKALIEANRYKGINWEVKFESGFMYVYADNFAEVIAQLREQPGFDMSKVCGIQKAGDLK